MGKNSKKRRNQKVSPTIVDRPYVTNHELSAKGAGSDSESAKSADSKTIVWKYDAGKDIWYERPVTVTQNKEGSLTQAVLPIPETDLVDSSREPPTPIKVGKTKKKTMRLQNLLMQIKPNGGETLTNDGAAQKPSTSGPEVTKPRVHYADIPDEPEFDGPSVRPKKTSLIKELDRFYSCMQDDEEFDIDYYCRPLKNYTNETATKVQPAVKFQAPTPKPLSMKETAPSNIEQVKQVKEAPVLGKKPQEDPRIMEQTCPAHTKNGEYENVSRETVPTKQPAYLKKCYSQAISTPSHLVTKERCDPKSPQKSGPFARSMSELRDGEEESEEFWSRPQSRKVGKNSKKRRNQKLSSSMVDGSYLTNLELSAKAENSDSESAKPADFETKEVKHDAGNGILYKSPVTVTQQNKEAPVTHPRSPIPETEVVDSSSELPTPIKVGKTKKKTMRLQNLLMQINPNGGETLTNDGAAQEPSTSGPEVTKPRVHYADIPDEPEFDGPSVRPKKTSSIKELDRFYSCLQDDEEFDINYYCRPLKNYTNETATKVQPAAKFQAPTPKPLSMKETAPSNIEQVKQVKEAPVLGKKPQEDSRIMEQTCPAFTNNREYKHISRVSEPTNHPAYFKKSYSEAVSTPRRLVTKERSDPKPLQKTGPSTRPMPDFTDYGEASEEFCSRPLEFRPTKIEICKTSVEIREILFGPSTSNNKAVEVTGHSIITDEEFEDFDELCIRPLEFYRTGMSSLDMSPTYCSSDWKCAI